jgi:hypothetical protein
MEVIGALGDGADYAGLQRPCGLGQRELGRGARGDLEGEPSGAGKGMVRHYECSSSAEIQSNREIQKLLAAAVDASHKQRNTEGKTFPCSTFGFCFHTVLQGYFGSVKARQGPK